MFLNQGISIDLKVYFVGGEELFEFKTIKPGRVGFFNIKVVVIIIVLIHNPYAEGSGIPKGAVIHPVDIKVG